MKPNWNRLPTPARHVLIAGLLLLLTPALTAQPSGLEKKGLQVQMPEDAIQLGVRQAALNVNLTALVDLKPEPNSFTWSVDGQPVHFNRTAVEAIPVKLLSDAGINVSLILLTYASGDPIRDRLMLHPDYNTNAPNRLGAFNTETPDGTRVFRACLEFLAHRFSRPDADYGRAHWFIIGNEVTSHWWWANMGDVEPAQFLRSYERSVRIAHHAARKFSPESRVFISLDHHWNLTYGDNPKRAIPGRLLLDTFAQLARAGGDYDWHLAYHPYPENLFNPKTWEDKTALFIPETPRITFKNLEVLTAFLGRPELLFKNHSRRIILSEQGFHSDRTQEGDRLQAAAYCYAWERVRRMDGIDAFILHRHVDHQHEGGLNLGLWSRRVDSVATPGEKRLIYDVFRKAGTPEWEEASRFALPLIGIKGWDTLRSPHGVGQ